jgi:hypothetical protein
MALENVSPATRLLEKRRQMFEVQEALELQKQEFARKVSLMCDYNCNWLPAMELLMQRRQTKSAWYMVPSEAAC